MKINLHGNLKWEKSAKFFHTSFHNSWFTIASFDHMLAGFIFYILMNRYIINSTKTISILFLIHGIEDFLENSTINNINYSLEGMMSKLSGCNNPVFFDSQDHDSLQNFIGDNISFLIGSLIGKYFEKNIKIKTYCIWLIIIIWILLHPIICHLISYKRKK